MAALMNASDEFRSVSAREFDDFECFERFFDCENGSTAKNAIKIFHANIRSFKKNIDELMTILNDINLKFDIIILTETWGDQSSIIASMKGYEAIINKKRRNQNDGVIVFVNECLSVSHEEVSLHGATGIKVDITVGRERHCLLALYRSPSADPDLAMFIHDLELYCDSRPKDRTHWLVGDINCCILPESHDALSQGYLDVMYSAGFVSCIGVPTRVTNNTRSCIDHIFTDSKRIDTIYSAVIKYELTDHYFVTAGISINDQLCKLSEPKTVTYIDRDAVSKLIADCDWNVVTAIDDVDQACNTFVDYIKSFLRQSSKNKTFSSKNYKLKPWITSGLLKSIRRRDNMSKQLKKRPFDQIFKDRFKNYRNTLSKLIKEVKVTYYRNKFLEIKSDSRKLWKNIGELAGTSKNKHAFPIANFLPGGLEDEEDIVQVANSFNEFYVSVGANLASAVPPVTEFMVDDEAHRVDSTFQLEPVSENEIIKVVNDLRGGSSPGVDGIPMDIIKTNIYYLKTPLLHIVNASILQGVFPNCLKTGKVIPIYKNGSKSQTVSYRPITLACVVSKIIEKCVKIQLNKYLYDYDILFNNQFGFRSDKNLNNGLFSLTTKIHALIGQNKKTLLVFIDLAKAFDSVDREILIKKLNCIGVHGSELKWFKSYLSNRKQVVSILGKSSDSKIIDYGVIQGSTLGPLLFLVFINNLGYLGLNNGNYYLYADDTAILFEGSSWEEVYGRAEHGLLRVKKWFDQNLLTVNISKTKCLPLSLRADCDPVGMSLRLHTCEDQDGCVTCECVECVSEYKYLGVIFDKRFKWSSHVLYARSKLRKLVYVFSFLSKVLTVDMLKSIYYAYVQSILQFGILVWGGALRSTIEPLDTVQKAILKAALRRNIRYPSDLLFDDLKVFSISQLYVRTLVMYISENKNTMFSPCNHSYFTRQSANSGIIIPKITKAINMSDPYYKACLLFNKLPDILKSPDPCSLAAYKKRTNNWIRLMGRNGIVRFIHSDYV